MNIVVPPHPALRTRAEEVTDYAKAAKLVDGLALTLRRNPGCIGLAANQVGSLRRVIVWALPGQRVQYAINPIFAPFPLSGKRTGTEGCMSLPGVQGRVSRFSEGTICFRSIDGAYHIKRGVGQLARIWQHEIDHLDGVLFTDHLPEVSPT